MNKSLLALFRNWLFLTALVISLGGAWKALAPGHAQAAGKEVLRSVVGVHAKVPASARTARFLGTERRGSGVLIDDNGLVLTIGYLILEANEVMLTDADGKQVAARIVAYDHATGLGLLRAEGQLGVGPMRLGKSAELAEHHQILVVSHGDGQRVSAARVVSRRDFAGSWEYLLENAIFTSPPHNFHSGAALVGEDGRLLGIGSLFVGDAAGGGQPLPGNMFVPIDGLKPILADLLELGRRSGPGRPWIGASTNELFERVIVTRVSPGGPAAEAGLAAGDIILGVAGEVVYSQKDFYRKLWAVGGAGVVIPLDVLPRGGTLKIERRLVKSRSRYAWLKIKQTL